MNEYLDIKLLRSYTSGKIDLMIVTLQALIETLPIDLKRIEAALDNQDCERVRAIAHRIKPNFELVCTSQLVKSIYQIEQLAQNKQALNEIMNIYGSINSKIEQLLFEAKTELTALKKDQ